MDLVIYNKVIRADLVELLNRVREESGGYYLKSIKKTGDNVAVTCPFHKDGRENRPSCYIYNGDDKSVIWGTVKCFTCGTSTSLPHLIAKCFNEDVEWGKQWLIDNYGNILTDNYEYLDEITLDKPEETFLDESVLNDYNYFHPYMTLRGLTPEVVAKFKIGYNPKTNSMTMPVWDIKGRLVMVTERSVRGKNFHLQSNTEKPVYLLNFVKNFDTIIVCEGQIDALKCWSCGYPAVALFGAGTTQHQVDLLNKTGIRHYILMYDNDPAGRHGAERFKEMIRKDVLVTDIIMPTGKDCGDCSKEDFQKLFEKYL